MKPQNFIIGTLIVLTIILGYLTTDFKSRYESEVKEFSDFRKVTENYERHYGYDLIDDLPDKSRNFLCIPKLSMNDGDSVSIGFGVAGVNKFKKCEFEPDIWAYHVGINTIREMLRDVDDFHERVDKSDSIIGFRFYHGVTSREFVGLRYKVNDKKDLVAVPVKNDGIDFFPGFMDSIHQLNEIQSSSELNIYSKFRPCPRICGKK